MIGGGGTAADGGGILFIRIGWAGASGVISNPSTFGTPTFIANSIGTFMLRAGRSFENIFGHFNLKQNPLDASYKTESNIKNPKVPKYKKRY